MNVLMYFSQNHRLEVLRHFYEVLEAGGYFLLGHAETLSDASLKFKPLAYKDCRIYRKPTAMAGRQTVLAEESR
jgi:chemotaxis methyl-accepting protein methylase